MHLGVRRKLLIAYAGASALGAVIVGVIWPEAFRPILALTGYCLVVAWVLVTISNWWLHRSISRLRKAADAIGRGELTKRVEISPGDELAKLARSFNQMANRLEESVAEERILQEQLTRSEKLAVLGELAAEVAHEVNNPLDGVQNFSRIVRRSLDDQQRVREMLDLMDSGLYRIEMIIKRLLTLARSDTPQLRPTRLDQIIEDTVTFLEPKIAREEIEFVKKVGQAPVTVLADRHQMTQVMVNLVLNAIDSMPAGGRLTVRVCDGTDREGMGRVEVADTGHGIPDDQRRAIFEPFFTTKGPGSGTGLGLAVVARIVRAHQGHVNVESSAGQGTTFSIELPLADQERGAGDDSKAVAPTAEGC